MESDNEVRRKAFREAADYMLKLHLDQHPYTGAIDALKTAYDHFCKLTAPPKAALAAMENREGEK